MKIPIWQGTYWRTCNRSWWVGYSGLAWGGSQAFGTLFLYFYGLLWWSWIHTVCSQWCQVLSRRQGLPLYSSLEVHWSRQSCLGRKQWGTLQFTCTLLSWSAALARFMSPELPCRNSQHQNKPSLVLAKVESKVLHSLPVLAEKLSPISIKICLINQLDYYDLGFINLPMRSTDWLKTLLPF